MQIYVRKLRNQPVWLALFLLPGLLLAGSAISSSASLTFDDADVVSTAEGEAPRAAVPAEPSDNPQPQSVVIPLPAQDPVRDLPFGELIESTAERHGLDPLLVASVVEAESSFRVDAVSPRGALGLMQVMPFHVGEGIEPLDPHVNLDLGAAYLAELEERFDGRIDLVLAAYHAGPGAVERYRGVPPYSSTRSYVARVLAIYLEHYSQIVTGT